MLMPKRTKYRKSHRLTYDGHAKGNTTLTKGDYGLMALEGNWVLLVKLKQLVLL